METVAGVCQTRDAIEDIWGPRTPYKHEWPVRADETTIAVPDRWVQSACLLCSNGCGMDIGVKDGKIVGVRGRVEDRVNKGRLGPKGMNTWHVNHSKDRLMYPLIRKDGELKRASWDEAMSLIVSKTKSISDRLTAHGIGFYTSGQLFLEEYYALAMIGKGGLRTLHMDGNTRLCTATAAAAMRESFGSDGQPGSYRDIDFTDCLFLVGHNVSSTQTVLWSRMLDRLDGPDPPKLIVIDPRVSKTAERATVHLAPRAGTNLAVLNGLQHLMFENDWINEEWLGQHTIGLEQLRQRVLSYTPERVEEITGIPASSLLAAARILGTTRTLLSTALQGVYQSNQATASATQINNINLLRGLIGTPGSGVLQMNGQPTAQNNREVGCDGEYPGFRNYNNPTHMKDLAKLWNLHYHDLPHWNQPTHIENMLTYISQGSIEMFWISGTNPLVSLPNLPRTREILTKKELFVVCQDIFMTETAAIADVVLPAAMWGEKTGCFTNVDRTVHLSHKAVDPPGEAKSDLDIFLDFGKRMDFRDRDSKPLMPWKDSEEVFNAWKGVSAGRPCDYSALSYEKLTGGSGVQWPCNSQYPFGKERLFDDHVFFTDLEYCEDFGHDLETGAAISKTEYQLLNPAGRAILKNADYHPDLERCDEEFPIALTTGRKALHFHTRTKTGRSRALQGAEPEPRIRISNEDAARAGLQHDDWALVTSRRGSIQLQVTVGRIAVGQSFIPFHFGYFDVAKNSAARAANELTLDQWDPVSKQPLLKAGAIRVEQLHKDPKDKQTASTSRPSNSTSTERPGASHESVAVESLEPQSKAVQKVEESKPNASEIGTSSQPRERHLELWLGATYNALRILEDSFSDVMRRHPEDSEIQRGLSQCRLILCGAVRALQPAVERYGEQKDYGLRISQDLRSSLLEEHNSDNPYEVLLTLQGIMAYLAHVHAHLTVLITCSQALRDPSFEEGVNDAMAAVKRIESWLQLELGVRGPQTLLVPSLKPRTEVMARHKPEAG